MRAYSYRINVSTTGGGVVSVSLCETVYEGGQLQASDLVRVQHVPLDAAMAEISKVAAITFFNVVRRQRGEGGSWSSPITPPLADARHLTRDGAVQEPIPGC